MNHSAFTWCFNAKFWFNPIYGNKMSSLIKECKFLAILSIHVPHMSPKSQFNLT